MQLFFEDGRPNENKMRSSDQFLIQVSDYLNFCSHAKHL